MLAWLVLLHGLVFDVAVIPVWPLVVWRRPGRCWLKQGAFGPRLRGDYPPNLSILLSGGKETNRDSLSKGD